MIDTVIFDMDGLLIDSEPLWGQAMIEVLDTVGAHLTPELTSKTTGLRTPEVIAYWHQKLQWSSKSPEQVTAEILESVTAKIRKHGTLMPGTDYIFDFFKAKGFKIGLASSSPMALIEASIKHFGIASHLDVVASAEHDAYGKPHPAVYLRCASELGSDPLHCLAFEDSITGTLAGKAARMKVVAVPEPHRFSDPKYVIADLKLRSLRAFSDVHLLQLADS
jgi:HAD superfamily hydrolase (TIGR01509 family)